MSLTEARPKVLKDETIGGSVGFQKHKDLSLLIPNDFEDEYDLRLIFQLFNSLPAFASKKDAYQFPAKKSWRNDVSMSHFNLRLQVLESCICQMGRWSAESAVKVRYIGQLGEIWNRSTLREKQDLLTSKKIAGRKKLDVPKGETFNP